MPSFPRRLLCWPRIRSRVRSTPQPCAPPSRGACGACGPPRRFAPARWPTAARARSMPCSRRAGHAASRIVAGAGGAPTHRGVRGARHGRRPHGRHRNRAGRRHYRSRRDGDAGRRAIDHGRRRIDPCAAGRRRAPLHDRAGRQQHQRRRRRDARGARASRSSRADGRTVPPTPRGLAALARVDAAGLDPRWPSARSRSCRTSTIRSAASAARPRSSARRRASRRTRSPAFDAALARCAALAEEATGRRAAANPGAGAAGGLGFALQLLGGQFRSGAEVVAALIGLDRALAGADWAITGEGRTDAQTLAAQGSATSSPSARDRRACR